MDSKILKSIDTNNFSLHKFILNKSGENIHITDNYSYIKNDESPWGNTIFNLNINKNNQINDLIAGIKNQSLPNLIMTGPTSFPDNINQKLLDNGFILKSEAYGMICEINKVNEIKFTKLKIKIVENDKELFEWCKIVVINLFKSKENKIKYFFNYIKNIYKLDQIKCLIGLKDKKPATTSLIFIDEEGIGGIYFVATEMDERNKGYGTLITNEPLNLLFKMNINYCILQATELGKKVYSKLGFKEYCKLGRFCL